MLYAQLAFARLEMLMPHPHRGMSAASCREWILDTIEDVSFLQNVDGRNQFGTITLTRAQIYEEYRRMGTVPESEIRELMAEDELFPSGAVIYLRSVNNATGKVEGIMRLVSSFPFQGYYFNHIFTRVHPDDIPAVIPVVRHYGKESHIGAYIKSNFPNAYEAGRTIYAQGVNEPRVLLELAMGLAHVCYRGNYPHHLVIEAVEPVVNRYLALGLKKRASPVPLNDNRVLMTLPMRDVFYRIIANVGRAGADFDDISIFDLDRRRQAIGAFDWAINALSDRDALRKNYLFGYAHRALAHYQVSDYKAMLADTQLLIRKDPGSLEFRQMELFAQTGSILNLDTGEGDAAAAIAFLDSDYAVERYDDSCMRRDANHEHMRLFVKGLVYLAAGQYEKAKQMSEQRDALLVQRNEAAKALGGTHWTAPAWLMARELVGDLRNIYDPATGIGDRHAGLVRMHNERHTNPIALQSQFQSYRAEMFRDSEQFELQAKAEAAAQGLK